MTVESSVPKTRRSPHKLPAPLLAKAQGGLIDPAWSKVAVMVGPYPMMACGDEVLLRWHGLNNDGEPYRHEVRRFVTRRQVGRDVVFVVREPHLAELEVARWNSHIGSPASTCPPDWFRTPCSW